MAELTLIDKMLQVKNDFIRKHGEPVKEIRMHPEDYYELRATADHFLVRGSWETVDRFAGVPVVVDPDAPRLPRKKETPDLLDRG